MSGIVIEEIIPGCKILNFLGEKIVFGAPSDIVKHFTLQNKEIGHIFVLPDRLYDKGTSQTVEFPLYKHIFSGREVSEKFTIIGTSRQIAQIRDILQQTVIGPTEEQTREWSHSGEAEFVLKTRAFFRKDFKKLDEIIDFVAFDDESCARHGDIVICRRGHDNFLVTAGSEKIELNISASAVKTPPSIYEAPSELIRPMRLGAIVIGASSGFDPSGDNSNIVLFARHLGISIDGSPWMAERLNLYGIPPDSIKLFIITHLHDDHSNIFDMIIRGVRSSIATTNLIYQSFLVKASCVLNIPVVDVENLIHFIELTPGTKTKWFSNWIECFYTVHPIPTIGVCINDRILFSGDTLWGEQLFPLANEGIIDREYCTFLLDLPRREDLELIFMDGGGGMVHPEPQELMRLPSSIREKMYITHSTSMSPEISKMLKTGRPGMIFRLDDRRENLDFEDVLALSESALMKGMPTEWIRIFCGTGHVIEEPARTVILHENESSDFFYFLLQGTLKVVRENEVIANIHSGDFFGEMIFLGAKKHTATIISESPVKILAIPQEVFQDFIADETVRRNLIKIVQYRPNFFHTSIFRDTPQKYLQDIIINSIQRNYKAGETIIREGEHGNELFLILRGRCEISRIIDDCKVILKIIGKDDIFGEMAILSDSKIRRATVTALEPTEVAILTREYFDKIAKIVPSLFYNLTVIMDERRHHNLMLGWES